MGVTERIGRDGEVWLRVPRGLRRLPAGPSPVLSLRELDAHLRQSPVFPGDLRAGMRIEVEINADGELTGPALLLDTVGLRN